MVIHRGKLQKKCALSPEPFDDPPLYPDDESDDDQDESDEEDDQDQSDDVVDPVGHRRTFFCFSLWRPGVCLGKS